MTAREIQVVHMDSDLNIKISVANWTQFSEKLLNERQLQVSDFSKYTVHWIGEDEEKVIICNEKTFAAFLESTTDDKIIITSKKSKPIKVYFSGFNESNNQIIYTRAKNWTQLLEDVNGCFNLTFPNADYPIHWTDAYKDQFNVTNEKSFQMFLKNTTDNKLFVTNKNNINQEMDSVKPLKIFLKKNGSSQVEYSEVKSNWYEFLKELEDTFGIAFSPVNYRASWQDKDGDEFEVMDSGTYYLFLERTVDEKIRKLFITEKEKVQKYKVKFIRMGTIQPQVFYYGEKDYSRFLNGISNQLHVDLTSYSITWTDGTDESQDGVPITDEKNFVKFTRCDSMDKKLLILPKLKSTPRAIAHQATNEAQGFRIDSNESDQENNLFLNFGQVFLLIFVS